MLRQMSRGALAEMRTLFLELRSAALVEASLAARHLAWIPQLLRSTRPSSRHGLIGKEASSIAPSPRPEGGPRGQARPHWMRPALDSSAVQADEDPPQAPWTSAWPSQWPAALSLRCSPVWWCLCGRSCSSPDWRRGGWQSSLSLRSTGLRPRSPRLRPGRDHGPIRVSSCRPPLPHRVGFPPFHRRGHRGR